MSHFMTLFSLFSKFVSVVPWQSIRNTISTILLPLLIYLHETFKDWCQRRRSSTPQGVQSSYCCHLSVIVLLRFTCRTWRLITSAWGVVFDLIRCWWPILSVDTVFETLSTLEFTSDRVIFSLPQASRVFEVASPGHWVNIVFVLIYIR